ncbi:MAG TPA: competence/damage-inducible protein A, partial [Polyangiaceae bacterium]|nr:competence/damage-inducible protein A [Polyangiaceae bacterium]
MSAAILAIGTEITRGEIVNTNASWLADTLVGLGLEVTAMEAIPDDKAQIVATLRRLSTEHQLILCTGGLGPTTDDMTSECVATLLGVPLVRDAASLEAIRERMARFGRTMATSNEKQADFPQGAQVLDNRKGTAPGFGVSIGKARAFFMPGVPREMKTMFTESVSPELSPLVTDAIVQIRVKTFGMPESSVNDRLSGVESEHDVALAYRAHFPEIEVKVVARGADRTATEKRARAAADAVIERLGPDVVYGEGAITFPEAIGELLQAAGLRLGTAESCTGGLVAEVITERGGASAFFDGAIVSYANHVKTSRLGVSKELLAAHGAVSAETARAMAQGALDALGVDVAVATTGIAGPTGGSSEKPVGLVHFAVADHKGVSDRQMRFPGSREQVRKLSAFAVLALLRNVLRNGHDA